MFLISFFIIYIAKLPCHIATPSPILPRSAKRFFNPPRDRVKTKNATTLLKGRKKCDIKGEKEEIR